MRLSRHPKGSQKGGRFARAERPADPELLTDLSCPPESSEFQARLAEHVERLRAASAECTQGCTVQSASWRELPVYSGPADCTSCRCPAIIEEWKQHLADAQR